MNANSKPEAPKCWRNLAKSVPCNGTLAPIVSRAGALLGYRCGRCAAHVPADDWRLKGGDR